MAIYPNLLLYIEPKNPPSKHPVVDEATCVMALALRLAKNGIANYRDDARPEDFREGSGYRGFHVCSCGMCSSNCDYLLPNGEIANNLATHYLAYHRDEISEEQIKRVLAILPEDVESIVVPTDDELHVPKHSEGRDLDRILKQWMEKENPKPEPSLFGDKTWTVGFKDRGHGHGDFAVIDQDGNVVSELPLNENDREHAHVIVTACNHHNELIAMVEEALNMVKAEVITDVVNKVANAEKRLLEIKQKSEI